MPDPVAVLDAEVDEGIGTDMANGLSSEALLLVINGLVLRKGLNLEALRVLIWDI